MASATDIKTEGRVSNCWKSQAEARAIIAEHGCKLCTWKYLGEIFDVAGDLWCHHCCVDFWNRDYEIVLPVGIEA